MKKVFTILGKDAIIRQGSKKNIWGGNMKKVLGFLLIALVSFAAR